MKILLNEVEIEVIDNISIFQLKEEKKPDSDVIILNGFPITKDKILKQGDHVTLIKKGEKPDYDVLESQMISRHTPKIHKKLKEAKVAIAGLGGLGSNVAISLARIGVGYLKLIDFDVVEPSNLNRQQYFIKHLGMKKTEAMKELIAEINPFIAIETEEIYITKENIKQIIEEVDYVVEAFDSPENKSMLINTIISESPDKIVVCASGIAGYFSNNTIKTKKPLKNLYLVGDEISEAKEGCGLMAPRVAIAANHQANQIVRLILGEEEI